MHNGVYIKCEDQEFFLSLFFSPLRPRIHDGGSLEKEEPCQKDGERAGQGREAVCGDTTAVELDGGSRWTLTKETVLYERPEPSLGDDD